MGTTDINAAQTGAQADTFTDYSVDSVELDSAGGDNETEYINANAQQQMGYYKKVPELKKAINTLATWTIGKGVIAEDKVKIMLNEIKGNGKDTFNSILENLMRLSKIHGDSFGEIMQQGETLVNLKPLDGAKMKIVQDKKGIIKRYEQVSATGANVKFKPEDIFHLCHDRIGDEIHGNSIIDVVEWIILARNEAMEDYKKLLHRNVFPVRIWHLDTDDEVKIAAFKAKVAASKGEGEDIFIPEGAVTTELAAVPSGSTLDPKAWIQLLNNAFFQFVGVPQIIASGGSEITQVAGQIAYMAFEQTVEQEQLYIEEQIRSQLGLEIELEFPASLQNNLLSDTRKDGTPEDQVNQPGNIQPTAPGGL